LAAVRRLRGLLSATFLTAVCAGAFLISGSSASAAVSVFETADGSVVMTDAPGESGWKLLFARGYADEIVSFCYNCRG